MPAMPRMPRDGPCGARLGEPDADAFHGTAGAVEGLRSARDQPRGEGGETFVVDADPIEAGRTRSLIAVQQQLHYERKENESLFENI